MRAGLQAGFGESLAADLAGIAEHGFQLIRQDLYAKTDAIDPLVAEFDKTPLIPLFLIGGGRIAQREMPEKRLEPYELAEMTDLVVAVAREYGVHDYALEIGNEPDLSLYERDPEDFAEAVRACHFAAREAGFEGPVLSGGISNLNTRGLKYLARMMASGRLPADDLVIGFHRYPESGRGPLAPHQWFSSREDEWQTLLRISGARPTACTELGYHTQDILSDEGVARSVIWDLNFYEARGCLTAVVYQLNDGPSSSYLDHYGVRYLDGRWKPVAEAVKAWTASRDGLGLV